MHMNRARTLLRAIDATAEHPGTRACIDRVSAENPGSEQVIGQLIAAEYLKITPDGKQFRITRAGRREMLGVEAVA